MLEFLYRAYSIGFLMTCVAVGLRELADAIAEVKAAMHGVPPQGDLPSLIWRVARGYLRAIVWPLYLWRPWQMACYVHAGAILCTRGRARPKRPAPPRCRHPDCDRAASQAGWGCRVHFFKLSPDLRARIHQAAAAELAANGGLGPAWLAVAEEAESWLADRLARATRPTWRQPELPL